MIGFDLACKKANNKLLDLGYLNGFCSVRENESAWFFIGRHFNDGRAEYGNNPVKVNKETGECEPFFAFAPGNVMVFLNTHEISVPEKFRL